MACGETIPEAHGALRGLEATIAAGYEDTCSDDDGHDGDHLFRAVDGSGRVLHRTTVGTLAMFPR